MLRFSRKFLNINFLSSLLAITALPMLPAQADDVNTLKDQVTHLKAAVESSSDAATDPEAFAKQQAEFDRMREQLLAAEQSIIEESTTSHNTKSVLEDLATEQLAKEHEEASANSATAEIHQSSSEIQPIESAAVRQATNSETTPIDDEQLRKLKIRCTNAEADAKEAKERLASLKKELEKTRNKLLVTQAEVERLSLIARAGGSSRAAETRNATFSKATATATSPSNAKSQLRSAKPALNTTTLQEESGQDIVTVTVDKTFLRTGPAKENSQIMEVHKGDRLSVEDRQGEWFRVKTSGGLRAWIPTTTVAFGPRNSASPSQTVKIKSYEETPGRSNGDAEVDRAYDLIKR